MATLVIFLCLYNNLFNICIIIWGNQFSLPENITADFTYGSEAPYGPMFSTFLKTIL